ncbi:MAG: hypothetical protein H0U63_01135 [Burkholderiales bacterium]|nr:hypothetical protein [Burkholderiales bacterium]
MTTIRAKRANSIVENSITHIAFHLRQAEDTAQRLHTALEDEMKSVVSAQSEAASDKDAAYKDRMLEALRTKIKSLDETLSRLQ